MMEKMDFLISQSARMRSACTGISSRGEEYVLGPEISPLHARSHCGRWVGVMLVHPRFANALIPVAKALIGPLEGCLCRVIGSSLSSFPRRPQPALKGTEPSLLQTHCPCLHQPDCCDCTSCSIPLSCIISSSHATATATAAWSLLSRL